MGLDMYIEGRIYFWTDEDEENKKTISSLFKGLKDFETKEVIFRLGYWRKANAIHKWFVDNIQDENDDCEDYYVELNKLIKLKSLCQKVIENKDLAEELLPTQSGFFFGGTEYDEYYFDDLKNTIDIINKIIKLTEENNNVDLYYRSSW